MNTSTNKQVKYSLKDLNDKIKQKTSIMEFNLKKEYENKLNESKKSYEDSFTTNKIKLEKQLESKFKKSMDETERD